MNIHEFIRIYTNFYEYTQISMNIHDFYKHTYIYMNF
jgi:hypothetical protein